jgi:ribosomal-protein-alanine N-acetyltransferase
VLQVEDVFADLPEVETERLKLIKATEDRAAELFDFSGSAEATRFMTWEANASVEQTAKAIRHMLDLYDRHEVAPWLILHKGQQRVIGMAGYNWWQPRHGRAEISYALAPAYWGQGFATEAARAVIRFGFERMALNRVEALVHPENIASRRVLMKVGMVAEGMLRQVLALKGVPTDHMIYSLLRADWRAG